MGCAGIMDDKMKLDISKLSDKYTIRFLTGADIDIIYDLAAGNPLFYRFCPPFVTKESIADDMRALPPNKSYADKYYIGFFHETKLVAIMDLIVGFPDSATAFIGLFMVDKSEQGKGTGTSIIAGCTAYIKELGYACIRLGYVKGNPQSKSFWEKNGFAQTGVENEQDRYTVVIMQKEI